MPIDPSIPLQVQPPNIMSPAQMISLRNVVRAGQLQQLQLAEATRQIQQRQRLSQLYAQPGAIDPNTGAPSVGTATSAYGISPEAGIQATQARNVSLKALSEAQNLNFEYAQRRGAIAKDLGRDVVQVYDQAMKDTGGNQAEAMRRAQKAQNDFIDQTKQDGTWSAAGFTPEFEAHARASVPNIEQLRAHFFTPAETAKETAPVSSLGKLNADYQAGRISKEDYEAQKRKINAPPQISVYGEKGKPPTGYRWSKDGQTLEPVPGGPADTTGDAESMAKMISEYRQPPLQNWVLKTPYGQQVMKFVNQMNPQYDAKEYQARQKLLSDVMGGQRGKMITSFNVAIQHTEVLRDAAKALDNGDVQMFNRVAQRVAAETGSPTPTNFDAVKRIYADEIVKAIVASGGAGGGALADREEASKSINRAQSPEQLMGVMDKYLTLMAGQVAGQRKQYEVTGKKDFNRFLLPATQKALEEHGYTEETPKGSQDIKSAVEKSGWSYEPEKYDYRVNPDTGRVQRKAKGG